MTMAGARVARLVPLLLRDRRVIALWFSGQVVAITVFWAAMLVAPALRIPPLVGSLEGPELWAFMAADTATVAMCAVSAIAVRQGCRPAWMAMAATAAISAYPAFYFVALAVSGNGGEMASLLMLHLTLMSAVFAIASVPVAGRIPGRTAVAARTLRLLLKTTGELAIIWASLVWLVPSLITRIDAVLGWTPSVPVVMQQLGIALIVNGGILLAWGAYHMTWRGSGTPFPMDAPRALVIDGPYRYVRNPQVVGGLIQGFGLLLVHPTLTMAAYAAAGVLLWQLVLRPWEEADLLERFGEEYADYQRRVACWRPTFRTKSETPCCQRGLTEEHAKEGAR